MSAIAGIRRLGRTGRVARIVVGTAGAALALGGLTAAPALAAEGHVPVPPGYVYAPDGADRTLHDYCSYSPDSWGRADFRGPCARHDLCIEAGRVARSSCDDGLSSDLRQECRYAYGSGTFGRSSCYATAAVYYAAVRAKTAVS